MILIRLEFLKRQQIETCKIMALQTLMNGTEELALSTAANILWEGSNELSPVTFSYM
jgi:hypothetical protein